MFQVLKHVLNYLSFPFDCLFCHVPDSQKCSKNPNTFLCRGWSHSALAWTSPEKDWMVKERPITLDLWSAVVHLPQRKTFLSRSIYNNPWAVCALLIGFYLFWPLLIGFRVATICLRMFRRCRHSSTHCGPQWELLVLPVIVLSKKVVIYLFI